MTRAADPAAVLKAFGPVVTVTPATPALGQLRVPRLQPVEGGAGLRLVDQALFGFVVGFGGGADAAVWAGLAPVVAGMLRGSGVRVRVAGPRAARISPAGSTPDPADPAVVALPARAPKALVRYGAGVDPVALVAQVVAAYSHLKVVVIVRRHEDRRALRGLLVASNVSPGANSTCTLWRCAMAGLKGAELVLILDALHSTWEDPLTAGPAPPGSATGRAPAVGLLERLVGTPAGAAVLGFLPADRPPSRFERARLWQIYGGAELPVPAHGLSTRAVDVASHAVRPAARPGAGADALAVKRALWLDPVRNRRLARLARALASGDGATLRAEFPEAAAGVGALQPRAVLVLCEGLDQAEALSRRLPGWPLVGGLDDRAGAETAVTPGAGVIATALGAAKLRGEGFDAVVRADPGSGAPPWPRRFLDARGSLPRPLLLVDALDGGHPLAARWSRWRRRSYLLAGWVRAGEVAEASAWRLFRAQVLNRGARG